MCSCPRRNPCDLKHVPLAITLLRRGESDGGAAGRCSEPGPRWPSGALTADLQPPDKAEQAEVLVVQLFPEAQAVLSDHPVSHELLADGPALASASSKHREL